MICELCLNKAVKAVMESLFISHSNRHNTITLSLISYDHTELILSWEESSYKLVMK